MKLPTDLLLCIFDYLDSTSLCRAAQVSVLWFNITKRLEKTTWRRLFLKDFSGIFNVKSSKIYYKNKIKNPKKVSKEDYLMDVFSRHTNEKSWKDAYKSHFLWRKLWKLRSEEVFQKSCGCTNRQLFDNSIIHVGSQGFHFSTIREALSSIQPYCTMIIHPGVYNEQTKLSVMMPFQMIGNGKDTELLISLDFDTSAVRISNLSLKATWFSDVVMRIRGGLVQVESCLFKGEICVTSPGVLVMRYCKLESSKLILIKSCCSIIEHCEFERAEVNTEFYDYIRIEGAPRFERLTVCNFLISQIKQWLQFPDENKPVVDLDKTKQKSTRKCKSCESLFSTEIETTSDSSSHAAVKETKNYANSNKPVITRMRKIHTQINLASLKKDRILHLSPYFSSDTDNHDSVHNRRGSLQKNNSFDNLFSYMVEESSENQFPKSVNKESYEKRISQCCRKQEIKDFLLNVNGPLIINCTFSNNFVINASLEANVIVMNSVMKNCEDVIRLAHSSKAFVFHNRIHHCRGIGICLKSGSEALILGNEIYNMTDHALEIRKNTVPFIMANKIHSNSKSGISFISSGGKVEFNDIIGNASGINILHSSNPIVRSNAIRNNKTFGVVISERSVSVLEDNVIYKNKEANVKIFKYSTPVISRNFICQGGQDGVLIKDGARGTIANNVIEGNAQHGVAMIDAHLPIIYGNQICQNNGHGIYISRGTQSLEEIMEDHDDIQMAHHSVASFEDSVNNSFDDSSEEMSNGNFDNTVNEQDNHQKWIRRRYGMSTIEFNSIYFNSGCGIFCDTNIPLEIENNAIHRNALDGIKLIMTGVFGPTYGSPKWSMQEPFNDTSRKSVQPNNQMPTCTCVIEGDQRLPKVKIVTLKVTPYSGNQESQCRIRQRTFGQIIKNSVTENGSNGIVTGTSQFSAARFVLIGNGIYDNKTNGLVVQSESEVIGNDIIGNNYVAVQASGSAWLYLTLNRLHSLKTTALNMTESTVSMASKHNIVYTATLESDVFHVSNNNSDISIEDGKFALNCFNAFRSANCIEYYPENVTNMSNSDVLRQSLGKIEPSNSVISKLKNSRLKPIIIKETHCARVSVALSEALNSFNGTNRSEICVFL